MYDARLLAGPLSYPQTDLFLVCFSIASRASFQNVVAKWLPELLHHAPGVPWMLIGTKGDLRQSQASRCVAIEEAHALAKNHRAVGYRETSARTLEGVPDAFTTAIRAIAMHQSKRRSIVQKKKGAAGLQLSLIWPQQRRMPSPAPIRAPAMPPAGKAPVTEVRSSTFGEEMKRLVGSPDDADLAITIGGGRVPAHRTILVAASAFWEATLLGSGAEGKRDVDAVDDGVVQQITNAPGMETAGDPTCVLLRDAFSVECLHLLLEFWYSGMVQMLLHHPLVLATVTARARLDELEIAARIFGACCEPLLEAIANARQGRPTALNASIGTYLNDKTGKRLASMVGHHPLCGGATLRVAEGSEETSHLTKPDGTSRSASASITTCAPMLGARCPALRDVLRREDAIHCIDELHSTRALHTIVHYLHSDHLDLDDSWQEPTTQLGSSLTDDEPNAEVIASRLTLVKGVLALASEYGLIRAVNLCELVMTRLVDRAVTQSIQHSAIDVVDLLHFAKQSRAAQLEAFILHFLSSNFGPMSRRAEWHELSDPERAHVEAHRWPPVCYMQAIESYEQAKRASSRPLVARLAAKLLGRPSARELESEARALAAASERCAAETAADEARRVKADQQAQHDAAAAQAARELAMQMAEAAKSATAPPARPASPTGGSIECPEACTAHVTVTTTDGIDESLVSEEAITIGVPIANVTTAADGAVERPTEYVMCCIDRSAHAPT